MSEFTCDAAGVIIRPGRKGKYNAARIYIRGGQVVIEDVLTEDRALAYAQRAAEDSVRLLTTDLQRNKFELNVPEQLELFSRER